jgi:hypothetical protein
VSVTSGMPVKWPLASQPTLGIGVSSVLFEVKLLLLNFVCVV